MWKRADKLRDNQDDSDRVCVTGRQPMGDPGEYSSGSQGAYDCHNENAGCCSMYAARANMRYNFDVERWKKKMIRIHLPPAHRFLCHSNPSSNITATRRRVVGTSVACCARTFCLACDRTQLPECTRVHAFEQLMRTAYPKEV